MDDQVRPSQKPQNILVAEDEEFLARVYQTKLEMNGFKVTVVETGEQVVGVAQNNRPDLILLDLIMPKVDGFEALRQLKADTELSTIPVVVMSNLTQKEDVDKAMALGASDFIVKSEIALESLLAVNEKLLSV